MNLPIANWNDVCAEIEDAHVDFSLMPTLTRPAAADESAASRNLNNESYKP
jgi:hypothetical protein